MAMQSPMSLSYVAGPGPIDGRKTQICGMMTPKNQRRLDTAVAGLFGARGFFIPETLKDFKGMDVFSRELPLSGGRQLYFTDTGVKHLHTVVELLQEDRVLGRLGSESDISTVCRNLISELLSQGLAPEDGPEFAALVTAKLKEQIKRFTFIVTMAGVTFEGVDEIALGELVLRRPSGDILAGCLAKDGEVDDALARMGPGIWLCGTEQGTADVAQQKFVEKARRVAGLLSLIAASLAEWGATSFRIVPVMSAAQNSHAAVWLSFPNDSKALSFHRHFSDTQSFRIPADFLQRLGECDWFPRLVELINREPCNEVEEALIRAIYWFSDAQRDPVREMQLVKFWSCIECFFSFEGEKTTKKVIRGLAAVMVLGGYQFVPISEHPSLKKRIGELYDQRSRAVHDARYGHVTQRAVADLSRWAAWLIINVVALANNGYTTRTLLLEQSLRLDGVMSRGRAEDGW